jgi:hypothetical protein
MDVCALKLAQMCLTYPREIKRVHYNGLVGVRNYRKQYGREMQRPPDLDPQEVDMMVAKAIAHLESIHNTNDWPTFKFDFATGRVKEL